MEPNLEVMVAMPKLDLIVTASWIGLLVAILLAQAVWAWLGLRTANRWAREAGRLAAATAPPAVHRPPESLEPPKEPTRERDPVGSEV